MARTSNRRANRRRITQKHQDRRRLAIMFLNKQGETVAVAEGSRKEAAGS
ncbi:hypothetical protein [Paracoccus denitrificans]|jgi:hypothetical protein|nr:hypothetical protein [Paracoccus denitrificans]MBB4629328.1 hypothetical protein [Paracoccus denitrificans]MCU7430526.1 hypothetical protein [Paracoccus denitrificans]UFS67658.1 hypothetical protein LO749_16300 [Paracoccus denitrificans]UPV98051.1 hypothetical protein M0K93_18625 [Paracoccus denitrificans]WQO35968.1 hypothetical protein U0005_15910 [Paracoccus denitrificans]